MLLFAGIFALIITLGCCITASWTEPETRNPVVHWQVFSQQEYVYDVFFLLITSITYPKNLAAAGLFVHLISLGLPSHYIYPSNPPSPQVSSPHTHICTSFRGYGANSSRLFLYLQSSSPGVKLWMKPT